ncbi:hypothetical protein ACHAXA_008000 [Cyclostephanos tholiformis]|uniref:Uncharacterized protein n=1 Tax=Cyclostephanos tholiformis TaxID=382380 RepID=A0ABD3R5U9_9STRA
MARIRRRPPSFSSSSSSFLSSLFGGGRRRRILVAGEWGWGGAGGEEDGDDDPMDGTRGDGAIGDGDDGSSSSNDDVDDDNRDVDISPPPLLRMENEMLREERDSIFIPGCDADWDANIDVDCVGKQEAVVRHGIRSISSRSRASSPRLIIEEFEGEAGGGDGLGGIKRDCIPLGGDGGQGITTPIDTGGRRYDDPHDDDDDDVSCMYDDCTDRWTSLNGMCDCPVEPNVTFVDALRSQSNWLVGLLVLQSCSGIVLSNNEALLTKHPNIVYYLTMLVGAGGNAGNQLCMALSLSVVLSATGFVRALVFGTPLSEIYAIMLSLIVYPCTVRGSERSSMLFEWMSHSMSGEVLPRMGSDTCDHIVTYSP